MVTSSFYSTVYVLFFCSFFFYGFLFHLLFFLFYFFFVFFFFFFQAEDGIRDKLVTGVQTCALPICRNDRVAMVVPNGPEMASAFLSISSGATLAPLNPAYRAPEFDFYLLDLARSEERRVGKECRSRWSADH